MNNSSGFPFFSLLKKSGILLQKNDPLRLAGATAFFTTFALPAILLILIQVLGLIYGKKDLSSNLFITLSSTLGEETVEQVVNTLRGFRNLASNWAITIGGFIFLVFVATTLFSVIKNSLNQLWGVGINKQKQVLLFFRFRFRSFMIILLAGLLFLIGLLFESIQLYLGSSISQLFPSLLPALMVVSNIIISVLIVWGWFTMLFRFLPDGRPGWRVAMAGGLFTSILFNLGKWVLRWLLSYSNLNSIFGTSASIVLLLLFVFYSSLIFYYGACFTRELSLYYHRELRFKSYAKNIGENAG